MSETKNDAEEIVELSMDNIDFKNNEEIVIEEPQLKKTTKYTFSANTPEAVKYMRMIHIRVNELSIKKKIKTEFNNINGVKTFTIVDNRNKKKVINLNTTDKNELILLKIIQNYLENDLTFVAQFIQTHGSFLRLCVDGDAYRIKYWNDLENKPKSKLFEKIKIGSSIGTFIGIIIGIVVTLI